MAQIGITVVVAGVAAARRDIGAIQSDISRLEGTIGKLSGTSSTLGQSLTSVGQAMVGIGRTLSIAVTAPIAAAGFAAIQAGIDFEQAFSGVTKTVEGLATTTGQLTTVGQAVRDEFRQMSLEIPLSTNALAELGEVVGQLGVGAADIADVTALVAQLGVTTNMTAEDAASGLIRFGNILEGASLDTEDFIRRAGSALVALGNTSVSTESDILNLSLRLAAAGDKAKFTAPEIMAWATTLADLGVRAESGGSAVSKALTEMVFAVQTGADNLEVFAKVSGKTVDQFKQDFSVDASGALLDFVGALQAGIENGTVFEQDLIDMGLSGVRAIDVFGRLGNAVDIFGKNLATSQREWERAQALQEEFNKRAATTASMIQILKNQFTDLGITIFDLVKDDLVNLIKGIGDLVDKFKNLDPATQKTILSMLALAATLGPLLIIAGGLIAGLGAVVTGIAALVSPAGLAAVAIGGLTLAIGALAAPKIIANLDAILAKVLEVARVLGLIKDKAPDPMAEQAQQHGVPAPDTGSTSFQLPSIDSFLEGIKKLGGPDISSALANIEKIGKTLGEVFDHLSKSKEMKTLLNEVSTALGTLGTSLSTLSLTTLDKLGKWFDDHKDNIEVIGKRLANTATGLLKIGEAITAIAGPVAAGTLDTLATGLSLLFDVITFDWEGAEKDFKQGLANLLIDIQDGAKAVQDAGIALGNAIDKARGGKGDATLKSTQASLQGDADQAGIIIETLQQKVASQMGIMANNVMIGVTNIPAMFRDHIGDMVGAGAAFMEGAVIGINSKIGGLISAATGAANGAVAGIRSAIPGAIGAGVGLMAGAISGLSSLTGTLVGMAAAAGNAAVGGMLTAVGAFAGAGAAFIQGVISGIEGMIGALVAAAAGAGSAAAAALAAALKIKSPSKVTMKIGEGFMEGVILGIDNMMAPTIDTVGTAASTMVNALSALNGVNAPNNSISNTTNNNSVSVGDISGVPISNEQNLVALLSDRILAAGI